MLNEPLINGKKLTLNNFLEAKVTELGSGKQITFSVYATNNLGDYEVTNKQFDLPIISKLLSYIL